MRNIAIAAVLALATIGATAQTGISITTSTDALAIHYRGVWTPAAGLNQTFDLKDSKPDANGYMNSFYLLGQELPAGPTAGFNYYGAGAQYVPSKTLAGLLKSTNIPADSFKVFVRGSVGEFLPITSKGFITGWVGAGASVALNQSGSISWNPVQVGWMNPGAWTISSSILATFGNNPQSATSAKAARVKAALKRLTSRASGY